MTVPRFPQALLGICLPKGLVRDSVLGDMHQEFTHRSRTVSHAHAARWYWSQAVLLALRYLWVRVLRVRGLGRAEIQKGRVPVGLAAVGRRAGWLSVMRQGGSYAFRNVRRSPGFAFGVALTLGLGIGANATMFGVVERLLLRPPDHVQNADQVKRVFVNTRFHGRPMTTSAIAYLDYEDLATSRTLEARALYTPRELTLGSREEATRIDATLATASFFTLLGVEPALGRFYVATEDEFDAPGVVVLGHGYWQRRFGGDPDILGRTLEIGTGAYTVIGVAPKGFTGVELAPVDVWLPFRAAAREIFPHDVWKTSRRWVWLKAVVRLAPEVSIAAAEEEMTAIRRRAGAEDARAEHTRYDPEARVIAASLIAGSAPTAAGETVVSRWLAGVSLIVLIIACANVANLLLARGIHGRREIAVRLALGASRARLMGQLVTESLLMAGIGGISALLFAQLGGDFIRTTLVPDILWADSAVSVRVLLFTAVTTVMTGLAAGVLPALQGSRPDLTEALKETGRGVAGGRSRARIGLLLVQVALSVVLLVGAGLFVRSLDNIQSLDIGMDVDDVLMAKLEFRADVQSLFRPRESPSGDGYEEAMELYERAVERIGVLPGVQNVSASVAVPFDYSYAEELTLPGLEELPPGYTPFIHAVTPQYFATLNMQLYRGRGFGPGDDHSAPRVAVVNETMARLLWPDDDAIGQCLKIGPDDPPCADVVGIVRDAREQGLVEEASMQYYVPLEQRVLHNTPDAIFIRGTQDRAQLTAAVVQGIVRMDPSIRAVNIQPLGDLVDPQMRSWKLGATMFTAFGLLALVVAAIGLYSVLSFDVARRTHELGIRSALGASSNTLLLLVFRQALGLMIIALVIGGVICVGAGSAIAPLLYGVSPTDPMVFSIVGATLLVVAALASSVPARRATRVDPNEALRAQ
jgi:predicted permease